jgi:DNA helicase-2/ATP-dependent DNA helicase PcrA
VSDVQRYGQGSAGDSRLAVKVGVIAQHDRFGVGEVQSTEGLGDNAKATIKFQNAGVKTLLLKFAKLKIIG